MKKSTVISLILVALATILYAQPKYTKMASNQSAYKVRNLDGYKETGSKIEDRNAFQNQMSYKNASPVKPEAKGEGVFPILPEGLYENSMVAQGNYKSQFSSPKKTTIKENIIPNEAIPVEQKENDATSKEKGDIE